MSRTGVTISLILVIAAGLALGWRLGEPSPASPGAWPLVQAHFHAAEDHSKDPAYGGADRERGWRDRQSLRGRLTEAMTQLEARPCEPQVRTAFLDAYADKALAMVADGRNSSDENGPAFWRTAEDKAIVEHIQALEKDGLISEDEIGRAVMKRNAVIAVMMSAQPGAGEDQPPVLSSNLCLGRATRR